VHRTTVAATDRSKITGRRGRAARRARGATAPTSRGPEASGRPVPVAPNAEPIRPSASSTARATASRRAKTR